nr:copia protein [Tanacetum cinerariifolium]
MNSRKVFWSLIIAFDIERQGVKKYVSSLRYIALPNWFHEAHLESSNSDAQDACYADAPESSGISNPTATSKSPSAKQIESLTVESAIPTVSSPVPTACLDNSPETSIDTNGLEADLSNMESIIPASPTPTFRIHKDHPKSQIIGHVDTPVLKNKKDERGIVIRNKASLVAQGHRHEEGIDYEEVFAPVARIEAIRLFLAYASFIGFTVYQMDMKSAFLYGTIDEEVYVMQPLGFQDPEVYNFSKMIFDGMAQQSPHHDPSSSSHPTATTESIPTATPTKVPTLRQYSRRATRIAQSKALPTATDEHASLLRDDSQEEAFPIVSGLKAGHNRENIIMTSALPDGTLIKLLEDKDRGNAELTGDDAPIKERSMEIREEVGVERSTKRGSNDTKEMVNVLTSMEAANIFTSGVAAVSVPLVAGVSTVGVPTVNGLVPTVSAIFTTASVVTPYSRRPRGIPARDKELTTGEKIDLINELVKYQDHHAKILKYQAQQSKPLSKKERREFYMSVLRSHAGWETKHFRGMTLEEIKEKFTLVWKKIEDFVPIASKEEGERLVPVEEVYVKALQVKHPIIDWEIHSKGKKDYLKIIRLGGHTTVYQQASSDKEKELWVELKRMFEPEFEDQLWTHTQNLMHDPLDWKLYDTCGVHHDTAMALKSYEDADHAGCQDTRRSTSGSAQFLGDKLLSWSSKKKKSIVISTTGAEYIAISGCCA